MMLGKLFGAPLFLWFVGACCLLVTAFFASHAPNGFPLGRLAPLAVIGTVLLHAISLAGGTAYASANFKLNSFAKWFLRIAIFFAVILPLMGLATLLPMLGYIGGGTGLGKAGKLSQTVDWWGLFQMDPLDFSILSCAVFVAWALYVAYIAMARQIKAPHRWWVWLLLPLCVGLWFGGITGLAPEVNRAATVFLIVSFAVTCFGQPLLLLNPLTHFHLARITSAANARKPLPDLFELLPAWVPALMMTIVSSILALLCLSLGEHSYLKLDLESASGGEELSSLTAFYTSMVLQSGIYLLKSALLLSVFTLNRQVKKPIKWAIFTWIIIFMVLPLLLKSLGLKAIGDFLDPLSLNFYTAFAYSAVHCTLLFVVVMWVVKRERQN
jgi:hypothetical protein